MTPEIWQDIETRLRNLRADIVGQWLGDMDNQGADNTVQILGNALQTWKTAKPFPVTISETLQTPS